MASLYFLKGTILKDSPLYGIYSGQFMVEFYQYM